MISPLRRNTPSEQNVDARGIIAFVDALGDTPAVEPHSMMLLRHGSVIAEGWWAPYTQDRVHLLYSLSKSFTSTAVGFAVQEGLLTLDDPVLSHFPELDEEITDPGMRALRIGHILAMASGHTDDAWDRALQTDPIDTVRGFLLTPPENAPGSVFAYNQACTFTAAAILQKITGHSLVDFLQPRLFEPVGITDVSWLSDVSGRQLGFSGMFARTDAIARLGQFYLQRGQWGGRQILSADWIDRATSVQASTEMQESPDWQQGYGYQFWVARHGYRGDGAYGQFCIVLPEYDAVLALTGQSSDMQKVLDLAWEHLLPAFDRPISALEAAEAEGLLSDRLTAAALSPREAGSSLAPVTRQIFDASRENALPQITQIELIPKGREGRFALTLSEGDEQLTVEPGSGVWNIDGATASSAGSPCGGVGTTGGIGIEVDILLLETPHRLVVALDFDESTFTCRWVTAPLHHLPISELRSPRQYQSQ
jgi:CubicO group peptidase (beta-lactamase class C family)